MAKKKRVKHQKPTKATAKPTAKKAQPKKQRKVKEKKITEFIQGLPGNPEFKEVELSNINLKDTTYQFRASLRVKELEKNIKIHGQKIPVILRDRTPYQIISGFRRIEALKKIGWKKVNAVIVHRITDEDALKLSILENEYRKTYSDIDRAIAIQKLRGQGKPIKEIAEKFFDVTPRRIQQLEGMLSFDNILFNALTKESIPTEHAIVLQQAKNKHTNLDLTKWVKRVDEEDLSYRQLKAKLKDEYGEKTTKALKLFDEVKGEKGEVSLRFWPVKFNPNNMSKEEAKQFKTQLERALEIVKQVAE